MARISVCPDAELQDGEARKVEGPSAPIAVFKVGGELYALADRCTHGNASMSEGYIEEDATVECLLHAARFCLKTGAALCQPATAPLQRFQVSVNDGVICVDVPETAS